MAEERLYQVTRVGVGFDGPGQRFLGRALDNARSKLQEIEPPYHWQGHPKREFPRPEIVDQLKDKLANGKVGERYTIMGDNYDQPGVVARVIRDTQDEGDLIKIAREYLGLPYIFGGMHSLNPRHGGDCSSLTLTVARRVLKVELPHLSEGQRVHPKVHQVSPENAKDGDLCFYHFSDRNGGWPHADDVTFYMDGGLQIGARPSRGGVAIFDRDYERRWLVSYGRIEG